MNKDRNYSPEINNFECKINELDNVEVFISKIVSNENFLKLNNSSLEENKNELYGSNKISGNFIAVNINSLKPFQSIMSQEEFFEITNANKKGISKKAGKYQEKLYGNFINAVNECDEGYISDVLNKAKIFKQNKLEIEALITNKKFIKEWRHNFGNLSPLTVINNTGNMHKINYIRNII